MGQTETKVTLHIHRNFVRVYPYRPRFDDPADLVDISTLPEWVQDRIAVLDLMPANTRLRGIGHRWRTTFSKSPDNWAYHIYKAEGEHVWDRPKPK